MSRTEAYEGPGEVDDTSVRRTNIRNEMHARYAGYAIQIGENAGDVYINSSGPGLVVPWRVPRALPTFVNQVRLLEWLASMIPGGRDPASLVVLYGPPGVGKTTVVRQFAHQHRDRFPGGQFHVDCSGSTGTDGIGEILGKLLGSLGISDKHMPPGPDERQGLFLSLTNGKPILVVLENANQAPHVRAALPNSRGSMVLVTAGDLSDLDELVADGARFRAVERFSPASAVELLSVICGQERVAAESVAADALARLCDGMPNTICLAGRHLVRNRALTIAQVFRELSPTEPAHTKPAHTEPTHTEPLPTADIAHSAGRGTGTPPDGELTVSRAYDALYDSLPEQSRRLYRLLGSLPLPDVSVAALATAAGRDTATAMALLDDLRAAALVEERPGGRYGLHDLAREHASGLAARADQAGDHDRALHALVRWFLLRSAYADHAIMGKDRARIASLPLPGDQNPFAAPNGKQEADAWLDGERASMVPLVQAAAEHGWDDEAWQLAEALTGGYYYNHRHLADWLAVSRLGIRAAQRAGNERAEARLRLSASRAHTDRGDLDLARDQVEIAMDIAGRGDDLRLRASAHEFRGRYLEASDPGRALIEYARSRDLNLQAGEPRGAALATFFAARLRAESARPTRDELGPALRDLRESASEFRGLGDNRMAGRALIAVGMAEERLGRDWHAAQALEEAVRELGDAHYAAEALEKLGGIAERAGDTAAARRHLLTALRIYENAGHPRARDIIARLQSP